MGSRKAKVASRVQGSGKDVGEENRDKEQQDVLNTFASMATSWKMFSKKRTNSLMQNFKGLKFNKPFGSKMLFSVIHNS